MTPDDATAAVRAAITRIAPDVDVERRGELDLDSMDFLNVLAAIAERTGIEVPERDYPQVATFCGLVDYLTRT
jgi:acyl carrier protein